MVCSYLWASLASTHRTQFANQHLATQPGSRESGIACGAMLGGPHTFRVGAVTRMCLAYGYRESLEPRETPALPRSLVRLRLRLRGVHCAEGNRGGAAAWAPLWVVLCDSDAGLGREAPVRNWQEELM